MFGFFTIHMQLYEFL